MPITVDARSLEARYAKQTSVEPATPEQDLYYPGSGQAPPKTAQAQIPQGQPVPEGTVVSQVVGRGQPAPAISVVPPQQPGGPPAPQIAMVPPTGAGRTTIGTFVESKTNPLKTQAHTPVEPLKPPLPEPNGELVHPDSPPKPKKKLDLVLEILNYITELGGEKSEEAQKFFDRTDQTLHQWFINPTRIPLEALTKLLNRKPGIHVELAEQLEPHLTRHDGGLQSLPNRGKTSAIVCAPILGQPTLPFMWVLLYLAKKYELGFDIQSDTVIHRSRNMLAHRFLQSGATWSLWLDSDIAPPISNPEWYYWLTGAQSIPEETARYDVLQRLLASGKAVIGGVYASRRYLGQLVIQPEIRPRSHEDKLLCNDIRKGTARGLVDVDWLGFGCALVHRDVFLEVQRRFPQLSPQAEQAPWRFFQPEGDEGEDEIFCKRVKACGIPIWLDTQLLCGHIGNMCFLPEHTRAIHGL